MLVCLTAARTFAPIAHLTREWTRNFTGSTPSTRRRSPPQGARAIDGKLRRQGRRPRVPAPEQKDSSTDPYTPSNKTRRPTAAPEQYHLRTSPDFVDPPAATAAAAASPQREAAAAPVLG